MCMTVCPGFLCQQGANNFNMSWSRRWQVW